MTFNKTRAALPLAALVALSACASTAPRQEISFIAADAAGCTRAYQNEMDRQDNQALGTFLGGGLIGVMVTADDRERAKTEAVMELRACYDRLDAPENLRLAVAATAQPVPVATTATAPQAYSNPDRRGPNGGAGFSTF